MNLPLLCVHYDFLLLPSVFLLWMDSRLMTLAQTLPHRSRYLNHLINAYGRLFLLLSLGFFLGLAHLYRLAPRRYRTIFILTLVTPLPRFSYDILFHVSHSEESGR